MRILLIDTCGAQGSLAIADTGFSPPKIVSVTLPGRSASERLIGAVRELAVASGVVLHDLDAIAVVNGPGSFTGVRVGLSAAKGLCEALSLPLIVISRLAVLALLAEAKPGVRVFPLLDAGRGEFYIGEYLDGMKVRETMASREEVAALLDTGAVERVLVAYEEAVAKDLAEFGPLLVKEPDASAALPLAVGRIEQSDLDDVVSVDANYLRRTDLEIFAKINARTSVECP
jgi:tRNA threonylcarbamoyladenosine biosynthesis protein TsaB